jgi:hypothetical protein
MGLVEKHDSASFALGRASRYGRVSIKGLQKFVLVNLLLPRNYRALPMEGST